MIVTQNVQSTVSFQKIGFYESTQHFSIDSERMKVLLESLGFEAKANQTSS